MTQQEIREQARERYALTGATNDDLLTDTLVNRLIDEWHRRLADLLRCYQTERGAAGTSFVSVNGQYYLVRTEDDLEIDPHSMQINDGLVYRHLQKRLYRSLAEQYGQLETVTRGVPLYWYERPGGDAATVREFGLVPGPSVAIVALSTAIRYRHWFLPVDLTATTGVPDLPERFHSEAFLPAVCWRLAETEFTQGRLDPTVVELWKGRAKAALVPLMVQYGQDPRRLEAL